MALFSLARDVLGPPRADRCLELGRLARLSRRSMATGTVAELIADRARLLGEAWWSRSHEDMVIDSDPDKQISVVRWEDRGTPDEYLAQFEEPFKPGEYTRTLLETVGWWIQDDAADLQGGRPVDFVDLYDPIPSYRIVLPSGAQPGDRVVAAFDPGSRVWVEIVEWDQPDPKAEARGHRRGLIGGN
jgi:hypothetical protein